VASRCGVAPPTDQAVPLSFVIEELSPSHERRQFSCGIASLDRYFEVQAGQDVRKRYTNCYVAVSESNRRVAGYYTLSATSISAADLPPDLLRRLPRYPTVPGALIGRLAIDSSFQGQGLGGALIANAVARALRADLRAYAIVVEAKDVTSAAFYHRLQFTPLINRPMTLLLPIERFAELRGLEIE
jgi:ribosomal protein S18 acetylase RimI-like enzyme